MDICLIANEFWFDCEQKLSVGEDPVSAFILSAEAATAGAESTIQMQAQVSLSELGCVNFFSCDLMVWDWSTGREIKLCVS